MGIDTVVCQKENLSNGRFRVYNNYKQEVTIEIQKNRCVCM